MFNTASGIAETSTTTGTGTYTLGGAVTGCQTFYNVTTRPLGSVWYVEAVDVDGSGNRTTAGRETFLATLLTSTTLGRTAILESTNAGAAVSWIAGTRRLSATLLGSTLGLEAQWFGDGSDGNFAPSSGTTTLTRDVYYNNLTITGTASIAPNEWRIFVAGVLDLSNAPANAIASPFINGNTGAAVSGGAGAPDNYGNTVGARSGGTAGGSGALITGAQAAGPYTNSVNGGASGASGKGGTSGANTGGLSRPSVIPTNVNLVRLPTTAVSAYGSSSSGGAGGGGGAGDGTNSGTGGGGGGLGGGCMFVACRTIITSASTTAGAIASSGGTSGNGCQTAPLGNASGGGGASGASGGWVYILYAIKGGAAVTNLIIADGGRGGNGGPGFGTGRGGDGGQGGSGGRITLFNLMTGITTEASPTYTLGTTPTAATTTAGTTGTAGAQIRVTL
jgi:hypothetical protein